MARKADAEADAASKAILDQLQTKTVGAPPSSTGLTGDQLPETIFDVADFETVKNQITLQLSNLELLNVLNTIGQVTNTQSQSGPIPKTGEVKNLNKVGTAANGTHILLQANPGEVLRVEGISLQTTNVVSVRYKVQVKDLTTDAVIEIADETISGTKAIVDPSFLPLHIDENVALQVEISNATSSSISDVDTLYHRVR